MTLLIDSRGILNYVAACSSLTTMNYICNCDNYQILITVKQNSLWNNLFRIMALVEQLF